MCQGELPEYVAMEQNGQGYIIAAVPSTLNQATGTIIVWIDRMWSTNDGATHGLISIGGGCGFPGASGGSCDYNSVEVFKYQTNQWFFRAWNPSGTNCDVNIPDASIPGAAWHQIAFEWNSLELQVQVDDGTPVTCSQNHPSAAWQTQVLYIGEGYGATSFVGQLANLQIYNTTLSQAEITALYDEGIGGAPIRPQNIVGWWPLNGNAQDYSGNNNNGQATGITYSSSWTSGYGAP